MFQELFIGYKFFQNRNELGIVSKQNVFILPIFFKAFLVGQRWTTKKDYTICLLGEIYSFHIKGTLDRTNFGKIQVLQMPSLAGINGNLLQKCTSDMQLSQRRRFPFIPAREGICRTCIFQKFVRSSVPFIWKEYISPKRQIV